MVLSPAWKGYNVTNLQGHDCGLLGPGNSVVRWPREDATESLKARVLCPRDAPWVGLGPAPRPLSCCPTVTWGSHVALGLWKSWETLESRAVSINSVSICD